MDEEFEREMISCSVCQNVRISTPSAPLISWKWPARHFQSIHIDFCQKRSEYFWIVFFVILNRQTYSTSITTEKTINELRLIFAQHGFPEEVVSDNEPQFISNEFAEFMHKNGIKPSLLLTTHDQMGWLKEQLEK